MYVLANIKVRYGQIATFAIHMAKLKTLMERRGWKLIGAYQAVLGDYTAVTHIWRVESAEMVTSSLFDAQGDPEVIEVMAALSEVVLEETTQLVVETPYLNGVSGQ